MEINNKWFRLDFMVKRVRHFRMDLYIRGLDGVEKWDSGGNYATLKEAIFQGDGLAHHIAFFEQVNTRFYITDERFPNRAVLHYDGYDFGWTPEVHKMYKKK